MKAKTLVSFVLALVVGMSAEEPARGQSVPTAPVPSNCSGRNLRSYQQGLTSGRALVRAAWGNVNQDYDRLEEFQNIVVNNIERLTVPAKSSDFVICRYTGTVDGVYDELDALYVEAGQQCFMDGELIGESAATVYCELSIALGGLASADLYLRGPVYTCGVNFEIGCDTKFDTVSKNYKNTTGACVPYTKDKFAQVWDETRNNQCIYEPPPRPFQEEAAR